MEKRGSYSAAADPFHDPRNAAIPMEYSRDMLPNTLSYLRRSVLIGVNPDWTDAHAGTVTDAIRRCASRVADGQIQ